MRLLVQRVLLGRGPMCSLRPTTPNADSYYRDVTKANKLCKAGLPHDLLPTLRSLGAGQSGSASFQPGVVALEPDRQAKRGEEGPDVTTSCSNSSAPPGF